MRELSVTFDSADAGLADALTHLINRADDDYPVVRHVRFAVGRRSDGRLELAEGGGPPRVVPDVNALLTAVHRRLVTHLHSIHDPRPAVHAGAVTIGDKLIVVTGNRGAGKTTLLLRLALDGAVFHCDEHIVADASGCVRTLPRRLHVKPGTIACLPEIAAACRAHPFLQLDGGVAFYPLDVADLGLTWRSVDERPAVWIHLTAAFDGPPAVEPIAQIEMVKRLMQQSLGDLDFGRQAADIAAVVRGVPCYAMRVGALGESAATVRSLAARLRR